MRSQSELFSAGVLASTQITRRPLNGIVRSSVVSAKFRIAAQSGNGTLRPRSWPVKPPVISSKSHA
jgi:hypothetical protein